MKTKVVVLFKELLNETAITSWALLKITIPVVIITKILTEIGMIAVLSTILEPIMNMIGLPGSMGLVWATALLTNLYGAMVVFATLAPDINLSIAQATIICSAMLIAHSLPLELTITKKAGAPFLPIALLRFFGAFVYCFLLHSICRIFHLWGEPVTILFKADNSEQSLQSWGISQVENLALIVLVIFCILIIMKILRFCKVLTLFEKVLEPVLPWFGMSKNAAPVTVVGMVLGISYGGALIIRETNSGSMSKRDVFFSLALMGLSHSLVEDTLVMMALGAHLGGILCGRLVFSLVIIYMLAQVIKEDVSKSSKCFVEGQKQG